MQHGYPKVNQNSEWCLCLIAAKGCWGVEMSEYTGVVLVT